MDQITYPVYNKTKRELSDLFKRLDIREAMASPLLKRLDNTMRAMKAIVEFHEASEINGTKDLTSSEAIHVWHKSCPLYQHAGAFLQMGLDVLFHAMRADWRNEWHAIKLFEITPEKLHDMIVAVKQEKDDNERLKRA